MKSLNGNDNFPVCMEFAMVTHKKAPSSRILYNLKGKAMIMVKVGEQSDIDDEQGQCSSPDLEEFQGSYTCIHTFT